MLRLQSKTEPEWVLRWRGHHDLLLLDHAHCEKKAASTGVGLLFRYPHHPELMVPLSEMAREELRHFEQVLALLAARDIPFAPLQPSPYAAGLYQTVRKRDPERLLDVLLICALIEARSCERMQLLALHLDDPELAAVYDGLLESEARHHAAYVELALGRFDKATVFERLTELSAHEAEVLARPSPLLRLHT